MLSGTSIIVFNTVACPLVDLRHDPIELRLIADFTAICLVIRSTGNHPIIVHRDLCGTEITHKYEC